ncbi:MAG: hypothetical protein P8Y18_06980 [Candidatus Bathyarchaeota archaeon]
MNQKISGLYKGVISNPSASGVRRTELELRVDVDGPRSLNAISGDFYAKTNSTRKYLSSFIFQGIMKNEITPSRVLLTGNKGKFSSNSNLFKEIKILISTNSCPLKATFQGATSSKSKLKFLCKYSSRYFRTVYLEHDYEEGVMPLESIETANLPSPSPYRSQPIGIIDAFAEAGIEIIIVKEKRDSVPTPEGTPISKAVWTNCELHKAILKHFTLVKDEPQWNLWLLSANEHVMSNIYGTMIGGKNVKRRGCAVFQYSTGWQSTEEKRFRLFIYVHELGHCFNLNHSWEKPQSEQSSEMERYASLSWMNLPWRYYLSEEFRGAEAFWKAFNFQFDSSELMHLRHGFRNDVIFGGNAFNREIDTKSKTT